MNQPSLVEQTATFLLLSIEPQKGIQQDPPVFNKLGQWEGRSSRLKGKGREELTTGRMRDC